MIDYCVAIFGRYFRRKFHEAVRLKGARRDIPGLFVSLLLLSVPAVYSQPVLAEPVFERTTSDTTGAVTWRGRFQGVEIQFTQLLPDLVRAFYAGRRFSPQASERFATACVFMTVLRNDDAPGVVEYELNDWRVRQAGKAVPPPPIEFWMQQWRDLDVAPPGQIAFRWAQFPATQAYQPGGDWNQGMLAFSADVSAPFAVSVRWHVDGEHRGITFEEMRCAEDRP